jgi:hypothetical protein
VAAAVVIIVVVIVIVAPTHALVVVLMLTVSHGLLFNNSCFEPVNVPASPNHQPAWSRLPKTYVDRCAGGSQGNPQASCAVRR